MKTISLLKDWQLREERLSSTKDLAAFVATKTDGWMGVESLPCDVHDVLIKEGKIEEPTVADNSFKCEWIEKRSWWWKKSFTLTEDDISQYGVELFIEMLDIHADIFLNGQYIAHHPSAMYAFRKDVQPWLKVGENELLIRLSVGLEYAETEGFDLIRDFVACEWRYRREGRGEERRVMLRKPQYVFGWDQSLRIGTCAISGDVRLDVLDEVVVRDIKFETVSLGENKADISVQVEVESRELLRARDCEITLSLEKDGKVVYTATQDYMSQAGINYRKFNFTLENPSLWWPNGYGEQNLYTVKVSVVNHLGAKDEKSITAGIRTIELDTSFVDDENKICDKERHYTFVVNGKRIYARGMDFIHTEGIYARTTKAMEEQLLRSLKDASFCMLRFWDGHIYQTDDVYDLCDKLGFLVIQNFCLSCSGYPDYLENFRIELEKEARYQIRRLRSHPSLAIWYGNGESLNLLAAYAGTPAIPGSTRYFTKEYNRAVYTGGTWLVGELFPKLCNELCERIPYQCTTPFGGFETCSSEVRGSTHFYPFLNLNPDFQQTRISTESFDNLKTHFVAECGVMGPPSVEAFTRYMGGAEHYYADDKVYEHHRNTFERYAVRDGIYKHFTGEKALSLEEYCLYGGMFQGEMLEYAADHIRCLKNCGGSVLWCVNDNYGEVGFSIMDRDRNPKPAYYFLKRAYNANRIVLKRDGDTVNVMCANAAPTPCKFELTCGYVDFEGNYGKTETFTVDLPAYAPMTKIATISAKDIDLNKGVIYAKGNGNKAILRVTDFKNLQIPRKAKLTLSNAKKTEDGLTFTVSSDIFAHGVHFGVTADKVFSDQYFDLLPNESKEITIKNSDITVDDIKADCIFVG